MNHFSKLPKHFLALILFFSIGIYSSFAQLVAVGDTICEGESAVLTATPGNPLNSIEWFDASGTNSLGFGPTYTTDPLSSTTIFFAGEIDFSSGLIVDAQTTQALVNLKPATPSITNNLYGCSSLTPEWDFGVGSDQIGMDIDVYVINNSTTDTAWDISGIFTVNASPWILIGNAAFPADFYTITAVVTDPVTGCSSDTYIATWIVEDPAPAPTVTGSLTVCSGDEVELDAVGTGGVITWYSDAGLTNVVGSGSHITLPPVGAATSLWVTESSINGNLCVSAATQVDITVNPNPGPVTTIGDSICAGETATLEIIGSGGTYEWYSDAGGNNLVGTGATFETPELTQSSIYYGQEVNAFGCSGSLTATEVVVNQRPNAPNVDAAEVFCFDAFGGGTATVGSDEIGSVLVALVVDASLGDTIAFGIFPITDLSVDVTYPGFIFPTGEYEWVWFVDDGTCISDPVIQHISIVDYPVAPLMVDTVEICEGESVTLFAFGDFDSTSYVTWYDEPMFDPIAFGWEYETQPLFLDQTFWASVTNEAGCEGPLAATVVVVNPAVADPVAAGTTVCEGESATLFVVGNGGTYTWFSDGAGTNVLATGDSYITPALAQTTTFYVQETNNTTSCQSDIIAVTAEVTAPPAAPQAGDITLCTDEPGTITATGSGTGELVWYNSSLVELERDAMPPAEGSLDVGPFASAGTYFFYVAEDDGSCESAMTEIEVVVAGAPDAPAAEGDEVCAGESATLTATGTGGTLSWYSDFGLTVLVGTGPVFETGPLAVTTSYWVTESFGSCESAATEVEAVVNALPETPDVSSNAPICEGESLELTAEAFFGVTYEWSGPNGFTSNDQNPVIDDVTEANNQGVYTLTITDNTTSCVSGEATVVVEIYPTPEAPSLTSNSPICEGDDVVLTAGAVDGGTYTWYDADDMVIDVTAENELIVSGVTESTTFGVSIAVNGCESAVTVTAIVVTPNPDPVAVTSNSPVCEGDAIVLVAEVVAGASYVWNGPNGTIPQSGPIATVEDAELTDAGTYTVYIIVDGCPSEESSVEVEVTAAPVLPQEPTTNSPICEHDTLYLIAPDMDGVTYEWSGPNGYSSDEQSPIIYDVNEQDDQGFYTLVVTDTASGCTSQEYVVLVLINKFPDNVAADNDGPVCQGEDFTLNVTSIFNAEYVWTGPLNFMEITSDPMVTVTNAQPAMSGTYEVTIILGDCASMTVSTDVLVYTNPTADAGEDFWVEEGVMFQLDGTGSIGAIDYFWTVSNASVPVDQTVFDDPTRPNPIIDGLEASEDPYVFILTVWSEVGCTDSDTLLVYVYETLDLGIPNIITPNGDGVNDTWVITYLDNLTDYTLSLFARGGTVIFTTDNYANDWDGTMDGDDLPEGTYWYSLRHEGDEVYKGFVEIIR